MSTSPLPPLYDRWITDLAGAELVGEPGATCLDCAMLAPAPGMAGFEPTTKCCTYTPAIPNYLVGAALADERLDEVDGRDSLRARIQRRVGVLPLGLDRDRMTSLIAERAAPSFGRAPTLRCPHYHASTGKCGVWLHRNSICSTWFCKHERGAVGRGYWHALRNLLTEVESQLTRWCVLELGAPYRVSPPPQPGKAEGGFTPDELAGSVSDADYADCWGAWAGREEELYRRSAELVGELSWPEVIAISGPELGLRARALAEAAERRDRSFVPAALRLRKLDILHHGDPCVLGSYTATDPLAVPGLLVDLLPTFRGQPTDQAVAEIARDADVELDDELLVKLVDFGILADGARER